MGEVLQVIVVIPFCNKDAQQAAKNVDWMRELDGKTGYRCMLAFPDSTDQKWVDRVQSTASQTFSDVHLFVYPESSEITWPAGANWAWQNVARYIPMVTTRKGNSSPFDKIYPANEPWLWLEADAIPTKPGWIDSLAAEYAKGGKPFMGHIVKNMGHMNGVGVYPNHVSMFATKPLQCQHAAWDVVMREETIDITHSANHLIQHCWVLINDQPHHNGDGIVATFRDVGHMQRILDPNAVLFHRCKDGSLIDCLMQSRSGLTIKKIEEVGAALRLESQVAEVVGVEIFIVTYHKDAEFLKYSLYSIKKFARGFAGVTVVCPDRDVEVIEPICREWGPEGTALELFQEHDGKGMLHHMAIKCMADHFCQSDFILHTDSDCIFTEPITPLDYFVGGKPVLLMEHYDRFIDRYPTILQWKVTSEKALRFKCDYETMRRHPAVHPRAVYAGVRERIERVHKMPFLDYVLSCKPDFPQGFSEFNVIGGYARKEMADHYLWIDTAETVPPKDKVCQFWSHGGLDRPTDTGAFVPDTPRTIIKRILGV